MAPARPAVASVDLVRFDNTGGIYEPFEGAAALSGFEAVGRQDNVAGSLGLGSSQQIDVVQ